MAAVALFMVGRLAKFNDIFTSTVPTINNFSNHALRINCLTLFVQLKIQNNILFLYTTPNLNLIFLEKTGGVGQGFGAALEGYVFVDRFSEPQKGSDIQNWFTAYLKRRGTFIEKHVFKGRRRFRPSKFNPITLENKTLTLLRFDMVRKQFTGVDSLLNIQEEGVIYFLILPKFEEHRTFFIFTGKQLICSYLGHQSELSSIERIISGFTLNSRKGG